MERLTEKSESGMVWFVDHENDDMRLEPCEMDSHHRRLSIQKLAEYENLEDRLNGISIEQVVNGFIKTVEVQTNEDYEHGRILTNAEADKWNEYKQLEEQGLLLRLPCKVGDTVYYIEDNAICEFIVYSFDIRPLQEFVCNYGGIRFNLKNFGKTVFLTQAEAEQKLKEMESD